MENTVPNPSPFQPSAFDLSAFFRKIGEFFTDPEGPTGAVFGSVAGSGFGEDFRFVLAFFSTLFAVGIVYTLIRIEEIQKRNRAKSGIDFRTARVENPADKRWKGIMKHVESDNPAEWRVAIIEADTILCEIVKRMGYEGDGLGDMLKQVEPSDFVTLNEAWEAHRVRNAVAHEGSEFVLTKREVKRVILLYEKVFQEFEYL